MRIYSTSAAGSVVSRLWSWTVSLHCADLVILGFGTAWQAGALGVMVPAYFDPAVSTAWDSLNQTAQRETLIHLIKHNTAPPTSPNTVTLRLPPLLSNTPHLF